MNILLDFLPITRGGGAQNALNLWREVARSGGTHRWLAVAQPELGLGQLPAAEHQALEEWTVRGFLHRLALENVTLPRRARAFAADVVLTPMGAGPLRSEAPRVLGWHDSSLAYPESPLWTRTGVGFRTFEWGRQRYVRRAARRARRICVQTETMAMRLARVWGLPRERFQIVPNGPSTFLENEPPAPEPVMADRLRILVIGDAKPSKNLEIVPHVAAALARRSLPDWEIVMTVPESPGAWTGPLERALVEVPEARTHIRRIGAVPHDRLGDLYRGSAVVLLPSFLESFSATYVEAMHFGVPLVTSDLDFARDICGGAALYADPFDAEALAQSLYAALTDADLRRALRREGFERVRALPSWPERLSLYLEACAGAVWGERGVPLGVLAAERAS
ncbi:MAG: glycosyltransferase [Gemmatimonadota bacterium]